MHPAPSLYRLHLKALTARYDAALAAAGLEAALIGAGTPPLIHRDDQDYPYRPEPLFLQWAPLEAHPGSALAARGHRPAGVRVFCLYRLFRHRHDPGRCHAIRHHF